MTGAVALAETHAAAFPHAPWSALTFANLLSKPGTVLEGDATSFVLGRLTLDEAEILTLATNPHHHRRGLARARLTAFLDRVKALGATTVFLEVAEDNTAAQALYHHAGFAQVGTRPNYYGGANRRSVNALILRRNL